MTGLVVDASVSASWILGDEDSVLADRALKALEDMPGLVPQLWHYEIRNILLVAHRRKRITGAGMRERLAALTDLPLVTDSDPDLDHTFNLANKHKLSFYDALYLELAARNKARLATLDKHLTKAARAESIDILE